MTSNLNFLKADGSVTDALFFDIVNLLEIPTSNYYLQEPVGLINLMTNDGKLAIQNA